MKNIIVSVMVVFFCSCQIFSQWGQVHRAVMIGNQEFDAGLAIEVGWPKLINDSNSATLNFVPGKMDLGTVSIDSAFYYLQSDTLILREGITTISFEWGFQSSKLEDLLIKDSLINIDYLVCDASDNSVIKKSFNAILGIGVPVFDTGSGGYINRSNIKGIRYDQFYAYEGQKIITKTSFNKSVLRGDLAYEIGIANISIEYPDSISYFQNSPYAKNLLPENLTNVITSVHELKSLNQLIFSLKQNYPNPFNPSTIISFSIPYDLPNSKTELIIYNIQGEVIKRLVNETLPSGNYLTRWDGTNYLGNRVTSGIYIYSLRVADKQVSGKMTMIK